MGTESTSSFSSRQRLIIGSQVLVAVLSALALVVMVNYLASRHFKRFVWASKTAHQLSPVTLQVLKSLTNHVRAVVFFDRDNALYSSVTELLKEYQTHNPKLEVEYVDYVRAGGRAERIMLQYGLGPVEEGDRIIFDSGNRTRVVYAKELNEYDYAAMFRGEEIRPKGFRGEQLFTGTLYALMDQKPIKAYFVDGHREHDFSNYNDQSGYLNFRRVLVENNIQLQRVSVAREDVPPDCQLLIVAGPVDPFSVEEFRRLDSYLAQGGRMLVLLSHKALSNKTAILEALLAKWGVEAPHQYAGESEQSRATVSEVYVVSHFSAHPIVKPLLGSRLAFVLPRPVRKRASQLPGGDAPAVEELIFTGPEGVQHDNQGGVFARGSIPLALAVEKGNIQGISGDRGATRLVVVGDSLIFCNGLIGAGSNREFARNAVNWLVDRDILLEGVGPRPVTHYQITMTGAELAMMRWVLIGVIPGGILLLGTFVWMRRRA